MCMFGLVERLKEPAVCFTSLPKVNGSEAWNEKNTSRKTSVVLVNVRVKVDIKNKKWFIM